MQRIQIRVGPATSSPKREMTTQNTSGTTPRLRTASFDDFEQIGRLQDEHGLGGWNPEEWHHLWMGNPAYLERKKEWPIGWVLSAGSDVVGYFGNIPVPYELNGKNLIAGCGHSWVVAPAYRSYSLLLLDRYLRQEHADLCVSTTVSEESCKPLMAMGASPVPVGTWNRSHVWITTYTGFVTSWLTRKRCPGARFLSYPISAGLFLRDAFIKSRIPNVGNGSLEIKYCDTFGEEFDGFWEALRAQNSNKLLAVRSRPILEWHFRYALRENRVWIVTASEGSRVQAYGIFLLQRTSRDAVKRLTLVDFQALADRPVLFYPILKWVLDRCRLDGVHLLESLGLRPRGIADIGLLAPYHLKQDAWTYWYKTSDRTLSGVLSNPDVWAPSLFDGDASVGLT